METNHENNYCAVLGLLTSIILQNFKSIGLVVQKLCYLPPSSVATYDNLNFFLSHHFVNRRRSKWTKTNKSTNFRSFALIKIIIKANHDSNYCAVFGLVTSTMLPNFKPIGLVDQKLCYLHRLARGKWPKTQRNANLRSLVSIILNKFG